MFETLERAPSEWIDEKKLRRKYGDLAWRLKLRDGDRETWVRVFVTVEFQSKVERSMALRVRTYADLLYNALPEDAERRGLPPILPIVLYNGLSRWTAPLSVAELVHRSAAPFEPPAQPWFTGESYILFDLHALSAESWPADNIVSVVHALETAESPVEALKPVERAFQSLRGPGFADARAVIYGWWAAVMAATQPDLPLMGVDEMEQLAEDGVLYETNIDRLRAKREAREAALQAKAREEVWAEARAETLKAREEALTADRALLKRQAQMKFGPAAVEKLVGTVAAIDNTKGLSAVGEAIIACDSDAELIAGLDETA